MSKVYIAIGSNIAPETNIPGALDALARRCRIVAVSRFYRSRPLNRPQQPDFINGACLVETGSSPRELKFDVLRGIEEDLGRVRTDDKYAARTIDLDIALYDDLIIEERNLVIPDPEILERPFLFLPLLDIDRQLAFPGTGRLLREIVRDREYDEVAVDEEMTVILSDGVFDKK